MSRSQPMRAGLVRTLRREAVEFTPSRPAARLHGTRNRARGAGRGVQHAPRPFPKQAAGIEGRRKSAPPGHMSGPSGTTTVVSVPPARRMDRNRRARLGRLPGLASEDPVGSVRLLITSST